MIEKRNIRNVTYDHYKDLVNLCWNNIAFISSQYAPDRKEARFVFFNLAGMYPPSEKEFQKIRDKYTK